MITVAYKVRLGQGKSEFNSGFEIVHISRQIQQCVHISEAGGKIRTDMVSFYIRRSAPLVVDCRQGLCVLAAISLCIEATAAFFLQFSKAPEALLLFPELLLLRLR